MGSDAVVDYKGREVGKIIEKAENAHWERHDIVECRLHLNDAEDDGRHAGKRASSVERGSSIAESSGSVYVAHHQLYKNG